MRTTPLEQAYSDLLSRGVNGDALHDAFIEVFPRESQLTNPRAYLAKVTVRKRPHYAQIYSGWTAKNEYEPPDVELCRRELAESVRFAVRKLPKRERQIVRLRFFRGLSCSEIASRLHSSLSSVRSVYHRALCRLRRSLSYTEGTTD